MTFAPFLQLNFLIVRPRFCKTDFVHTAIAPCVLVLLPRALMVLRTFLIHAQYLSPSGSNILYACANLLHLSIEPFVVLTGLICSI